MEIAEVFDFDGHQAVRLPATVQLRGDAVEVRRDGETVILAPLKPSVWPRDFFETIRIDDPDFQRPPQGDLPPVPSL